MARDLEEWITPLRQSTDWTAPTPTVETWNARPIADQTWLEQGYLRVVDGNGYYVVDAQGRFVIADG